MCNLHTDQSFINMQTPVDSHMLLHHKTGMDLCVDVFTLVQWKRGCLKYFSELNNKQLTVSNYKTWSFKSANVGKT